MKLTLKPPNRILARTLETERFIVEPLNLLRAYALTHSWRDDEEITSGLYLRSSMSRLGWLHRGPMPNNVDRFTFAVTPRGADAAIGIFVVKLRGHRTASTGVALRDRSWWGKGAPQEVRIRLINHFFRHGPVDRFIGMVHGRNPASVFNYQRLGFEHIGTWHRHSCDRASKTLVDMTMFEMLRENWEQGPYADAS